MNRQELTDKRPQEQWIRILSQPCSGENSLMDMDNDSLLKLIDGCESIGNDSGNAVTFLGAGMTCQCYRHREGFILKILSPGKVTNDGIVSDELTAGHLESFLSSVRKNGIVSRKYAVSGITFTQRQELVLTSAGLGVKLSEVQTAPFPIRPDLKTALIMYLRELLDVAEDMEIWHSRQADEGEMLPSLLNMDVKPENYIRIALARNGRSDVIRSVDYGSCTPVDTLLEALIGSDEDYYRIMEECTTWEYYPDGTVDALHDKAKELSEDASKEPDEKAGIMRGWLYRLDLGAAMRIFHQRLTQNRLYDTISEPRKWYDDMDSMPSDFMQLCESYLLSDKQQYDTNAVILPLYQCLHLLYTVYRKIFSFPAEPDDCSAAWLAGKVKEALTILEGKIFESGTEAEKEACRRALLMRNSLAEKDDTILGRTLQIKSCGQLLEMIGAVYAGKWPSPAELYQDILFGRFPASDGR